MRFPRVPTLLAVLLLTAISGPALADVKPPPRLELETCRVPNLDEDVKCGTYEVFENRAARRGRKIALKVVVLPATDDEAQPDAVFFFAGGPGGSAVESAAGLSFFLADVRRQRDLVLIDQRGTGGSKALFCPYQERELSIEEALELFLPTDGVRECRAELEKSADLTQYTTANAVDDFDEVRAALGYDQVNLWGGSYGSRVALTYLRRHPGAVRSVVIEGVVPFDAHAPLTFARDAQKALDGLFEECAGDEACHRAFPDLPADLHAVLERLGKGPVKVPVVDPESGEKKELDVSHNVFVQTLRYMLYSPLGSLQVPLYLHLAAAGDYEPLGQMAYSVAGGLLKSLPDGLYLSVTCPEDVAFIEKAEAAKAHQGTFLGDFRVRQQRAACAHWPRAELPAGFTEPVHSDKPVLIVSGERDPVTPAVWGEQVARHLPRSRHLIVPDGAHGSFGLTNSECVDSLVAEFFARGNVDGLDVDGCVSTIRRPPFMLELPADEEIVLSEKELQRFAASYVSAEGGFEVAVTLAGGRLRMAVGEEETLTLVPVAPLRFKIEGRPAGNYVDFNVSGEKITGLAVIRSGTTIFTLDRRE